jgi:non-specific serine/threonine protein kinase
MNKPLHLNLRERIGLLLPEVAERDRLLKLIDYEPDAAIGRLRTLVENLVFSICDSEGIKIKEDLVDAIGVLGCDDKSPDGEKCRKRRQEATGSAGPILNGRHNSYLQELRKLGNTAIHPWDPKAGKPREITWSQTDVEVAVNQFLGVLEWWNVEYGKGRKLRSIYENVPGQHPHLGIERLDDLFGREEDIRKVRDLLSSNSGRLVTLRGSGGVGKTRLAQAVAWDAMPEYGDQVAFVALDQTDSARLLADPGYLASEVGEKLGLKPPCQREALVGFLYPRRFLLILDNCEHVVDACADLVRYLVSQCPLLRILATSRRPLYLGSIEQVWTVPSLPYPDPDRLPSDRGRQLAWLRGYPSVDLFEKHAGRRTGDFDLGGEDPRTVARICKALDGIPLALELAASRVADVGLGEIAEQLERILDLLETKDRDRPPRALAVRATIGWSYNLLRSEEHRKLLARMAVFRGGCSLKAVKAVCRLDGTDEAALQSSLRELVDDALVVLERKEGRYRQLETIRQFGWEKVQESGEADPLRGRHLDYYLTLAEEAEPYLMTGGEEASLARLIREHENVRSALEFGLGSAHRREAALHLAAVLPRFWTQRGYLSEGKKFLESALDLLGPPHGEGSGQADQGKAAPSLRARLLFGAGLVAWYRMDRPGVKKYFEECLDICRRINDPRGQADSLNYFGNLACDEGDFAAARQFHEKALEIYTTLKDDNDIAGSLHNLGEAALYDGDPEKARLLVEEGLRLLDNDRMKQSWRANCAELLGTIALERGDATAARAYHEKALQIRRRTDEDVNIPYSIEGYAAIAAHEGDLDRAARLYGAAASLRDRFECPLPPVQQERLDRKVGTLRERMGEAGFEAARSSGYSLTYEEAVECALPGRMPPPIS